MSGRCEVTFVEGSGNQFEVLTFGMAEGADRKPVEVLQETRRITAAQAKDQYDTARATFKKAETLLKAVQVAAKAEVERAAKELEDETKGTPTE